MKTGFKDPIAPKKKEVSKPSPWNFDSPPYDERSSRFVNAGTDYGTGYAAKVGTEKPTKSDSIPKGRVQTLDLYPNSRKADLCED